MRNVFDELILLLIVRELLQRHRLIENFISFYFRFILKFRFIMLSKETLRPLTLVMMYFMFYAMSGVGPVRPNLVNVCGAFGMPDAGKNILVSSFYQ